MRVTNWLLFAILVVLCAKFFPDFFSGTISIAIVVGVIWGAWLLIVVVQHYFRDSAWARQRRAILEVRRKAREQRYAAFGAWLARRFKK